VHRGDLKLLNVSTRTAWNVIDKVRTNIEPTLISQAALTPTFLLHGVRAGLIPCPGNSGIRLGCTSAETPKTDAVPGHGIVGRLALRLSGT